MLPRTRLRLGRCNSCVSRLDCRSGTNTCCMIGIVFLPNTSTNLIARLGVKVLKSPPQSPTANSICERVIGTIRRECLDWLIPPTESHLRSILKLWIAHYNTGRPHMALGPGVPDPPRGMQHNAAPKSRHRLREDMVVRAHSILSGLHHEYFWASAGAQ